MKQQTCIRLPADLLKALKIRAVQEDTFVNALVERAVRSLLAGDMPAPAERTAPAMAELPIPAPEPEAGNAKPMAALFAIFEEANQ